MNFRSNDVFTQNPNFVNLRIVSVNTTGKLVSVSVPTTRVKSLLCSSDCIWHEHDIEEATTDKMNETRAKRDYVLKSDFETMR